MKISFDLDDTLIPSQPSDFPTLPQSWYQKLFKIEMLRKDSVELFKILQDAGHRVGIYTTSFRSKSKIKRHMQSYGIRPDFIINEDLNRKTLSQINIHASKYPPAFSIDVHIDDSKGVEIEGQRLGFKVILVEKENENWRNYVLSQI